MTKTICTLSVVIEIVKNGINSFTKYLGMNNMRADDTTRLPRPNYVEWGSNLRLEVKHLNH